MRFPLEVVRVNDEAVLAVRVVPRHLGGGRLLDPVEVFLVESDDGVMPVIRVRASRHSLVDSELL